VEKVKISTRSEPRQFEPSLADGPMGELIALIEEYKNDTEQLNDLKEELSEIDRKLSVEVKDLMGWNEEAFLKETLHDVQNILLARLAHKE
jgi:cobalamin biosynthesis Mg chelatase CobN